MVMQESIRELVDQVFDINIGLAYTTEELSDEILDLFEVYFSSNQIYNSIKDLDYENHKYTRDVSTRPYRYEKLS